MQLEGSRAVLRTRKPYEAADLGLLLLRRLYWPTLRATLCFVLPVQLAVLWACSSLDWGFTFLALWWLKPLYDRPLGLVLGRGLFGEVPRGRAFLRALWAQGRRKLLADLTYRRLDPARSLVAPVALLEGVSGAVASRRRHALVIANSSSVGTLLFSCLAIELGCISGLCVGAMMLMPDELQFILTDMFSADWDEVITQMMLGGYAIAIALCEPLYVASGFGLYIDRRTTLEGWDIELAFRKMTRRLTSMAAAGLLIGAVLSGATAHAQAAEDYSKGAASPERRLAMPEIPKGGDAEAAMARVLERPELKREHVEEHWELRKSPESSEPSELPPWLGAFAKHLANSAAVMIWVLAALALALLLYLFVEHVRRTAQVTMVVPEPEAAEIRIRFDKLPGRPLAPHQVVPRARELLAAGDTTGALSVLYVGTLGALVLLDAVDVPAQATEGECLRRVGAAPIAPVRRDLFAELTRRWQLSAYAHVVPEPEQVHGLCERFAACFGVPA